MLHQKDLKNEKYIFGSMSRKNLGSKYATTVYNYPLNNILPSSTTDKTRS